MNIFQETVEEYYQAIGYKPQPNRVRHNVEMRAAFANAVNSFFHYADTAVLFNLDRTTIYHYIRSHETYYMSSPDYRKWYATASEIVESKAGKRIPLQAKLKPKKKNSTHEQIDSIKRTINVLEKFIERFEPKITGRKAESLQDGGQGGLRNDEGHLGSGEVHRVLRDEQLQVQDESRKESGPVGRDGHR